MPERCEFFEIQQIYKPPRGIRGANNRSDYITKRTCNHQNSPFAGKPNELFSEVKCNGDKSKCDYHLFDED